MTDDLDFESALDRLEELQCFPRLSGHDHAYARCPVHGDRKPSLSLGVGHTKPLVITCHAGCTFEQVVSALNGDGREIRPDPERVARVKARPAYRLDPQSCDEYQATVPGVILRKYRGRLIDTETGEVVNERTFRWTRQIGEQPERPFLDGYVPSLYRADLIPWVQKQRCDLYVCEGESDARALIAKDVPAVCGAHGSSEWRPEWTALFDGITVPITVCADDDEPGHKHARNVAKALVGHQVRIVLPAIGKNDIRDHLEAGFGLDALRPFDGATEVKDDPEPVPLAPMSRPLPFPTSALPTAFARMVEAVAEATQTDPAMAGTTALTMLATAVCGHAEIEIRSGWREPLALMTATVAKPGERKSAVQAAMSAPLVDAEQELVANATGTILELETLRAVAQRASDQARDKAGRANKENAENEQAEAISAAMRVADIDVPPLPRIIADDVTVEATASLLAAQGGRLAIISSEGGIFDTLAGRYSPVTSLDVFLKGHSGDTLRVDRRGRPPEYVRRPALTVGVMIQPTILPTLGSNRTFRGRGLLARFLYAVPPSRVGFRAIAAESVPPDVDMKYCTALRDLALHLSPWIDPGILQLSDEARAAEIEFERLVEPMLRDDGELGQIADWGAKLTGAVMRIAGLLHLGDLGESGIRTPVTEKTVDNAVRLGEYYRNQAIRAFGDMSVDPPTADAIYLLDRITATGHVELSERDMLRIARRFRTRAALDGPLKRLVEFGWLIPKATTPTTDAGRPPSPEYRVHPSALGDTT